MNVQIENQNVEGQLNVPFERQLNVPYFLYENDNNQFYCNICFLSFSITFIIFLIGYLVIYNLNSIFF